MRKVFYSGAIALTAAMVFTACQKEEVKTLRLRSKFNQIRGKAQKWQ